MKRLRNLVAVLAMMSMAATFTGCGDDDDGARVVVADCVGVDDVVVACVTVMGVSESDEGALHLRVSKSNTTTSFLTDGEQPPTINIHARG